MQLTYMAFLPLKRYEAFSSYWPKSKRAHSSELKASCPEKARQFAAAQCYCTDSMFRIDLMVFRRIPSL